MYTVFVCLFVIFVVICFFFPKIRVCFLERSFLKHNSFLLLCISGAYHLSSFICLLSFLCDVHKGKSGYPKKKKKIGGRICKQSALLAVCTTEGLGRYTRPLIKGRGGVRRTV